jgi:hypothetical protein
MVQQIVLRWRADLAAHEIARAKAAQEQTARKDVLASCEQLAREPGSVFEDRVFDGYFQNDSCRRVYGFRRSTPGLLRSAIDARSRKANILRAPATASPAIRPPMASPMRAASQSILRSDRFTHPI